MIGPRLSSFEQELPKEKKPESLPRICSEIREKLIEDIERDINLLSDFHPKYSPDELEGITRKYQLVPRNNFKVIIEQLENMKEKLEDDPSCIQAFRNMNFKFVLSEREPEEAEKYLKEGLISRFAQKH